MYRYRGSIELLKRMLLLGCILILIDEYRTSQVCPATHEDGKYCDGTLEPMSYTDEGGQEHKPWSVKKCLECGQVCLLLPNKREK